ncbi:MAG: amidohydrolase, partial [Pseudonocardiales bacterium]|nr:amidohydrolase [Pseudonocardiales bacterium]
MALDDALSDDAEQLAPDLTALRHRLHQHPEVGLDLPWTQAALLAELADLDVEITLGTSLSSITAVLRGGQSSGATVLLRGDMDALPVQESSGVDYSSTIDGAMHACGHDLHMAMLVGGAKLLHAHRDELAGDVVFMFQPGEEGWDGAGHMIAEGVLDAAGRRADAAYGMHVMSAKYPSSTFVTRSGTLMAASDWLDVTVHGEGAHGSTPHLGRDPISGAAEIISGLHALITRRFDVFDPVVLTAGSIHGGTKRNIIPDDAHFDATVRTFSAASRERMRREAPALCRQIGAAYGLDVEATYRDEYPITVNDAKHTDFAVDVVREVFGEDRYAPM